MLFFALANSKYNFHPSYQSYLVLVPRTGIMIFTASLPNLSHGWGQQEDRADPLFALALRFCSSDNTPEAPVIQLCTSLFWWFCFCFFSNYWPRSQQVLLFTTQMFIDLNLFNRLPMFLSKILSVKNLFSSHILTKQGLRLFVGLLTACN